MSYSVLDILLPSIIIIQDCSWALATCKYSSCGGVVNMLLVLSITFYFHYNKWDCMCSTGPFNINDWKDISIAHVIIIIKSEVSTFTIVIIFFRGCVCDVCCIRFCYLLNIHSGKTGNLFSLLLCNLWWMRMVGYVLAWRSYSLICTSHHLIIIIVQTYLNTLNL